MRIFFSVGEPSGDLHGANLVRELQSRGDVECVGFGGPRMREAGCQLQFELTSLAVMFFGEVLRHLRQFLKLVDEADDYFETHQVDAVVLIDFPGFNWWIAKRAKRRGIPVFYYGVPQMWAWAPWRIRKLRRRVDHVLCKLPFEKDWFESRGCRATYVGHPYFDETARQQLDRPFLESRADASASQVTLLPGSRNREVERVLPMLLETARQVLAERPETRFVVASFNDRQQEVAQQMIQDRGLEGRVETFVGRTPELMKSAALCLACSGSVSLELLHYRKPTIIVYKVGSIAMRLQRWLLRTPFITLVNLMNCQSIQRRSSEVYDPDAVDAEPALMPEYLTAGDVSTPVARRVLRWLNQPQLLEQSAHELDGLARQYAQPGATARAAAYLWEVLKTSSKAKASGANTNTTERSLAERPLVEAPERVSCRSPRDRKSA